MKPNFFEEWHWEITRLCNLRCNHCITSCGLVGGDEILTKDALLAIGRMKKLGCKRIMVTGGEPLARKDILSILEAGKADGMGLRLITNGLTANRNLVFRLSKLLDLIGVSLDGSREETHDALRGAGSFKKACRAISIFSSVMPVSAHITVSAHNIHELGAIIEKASELGATFIHVSEISILGRAEKNKSWLTLSDDQKKNLRKMAERLSSEQNCSCELDLSTVYLGYNGLVYPCSELAVRKPKMFLDNIISEQCVERLLLLADKWSPIQGECCYVMYESRGIVFCLGSGCPCRMIGD